ncbi:helix-turn-helix transcriptional regulator [Sphingopyxis chilensis]
MTSASGDLGPLHPSSPLSIEPISMRVPDACRFTGISRSTLYLLIARGEVRVVKMGASTLVLTQSLRDFINRRTAEQHRPPR